ncbi:MAG: RNA methyltransferase [Deltaproteobacteria bacterium]|jgi:hypothetical protein|nr:RNA methyltransferase [Deltaproteobacteria bacterium]
MTQTVDLSLALLHSDMLDKQGSVVTTSLTLIDVHDIARSCRTYGINTVFIAHTSPTLRKLCRILKNHWEEGFGATYNPNRKEALANVEIVCDLDEAIQRIDLRCGKLPKLIATSAHPGADRIKFNTVKELLKEGEPYLLMFGTGWGMSPNLINRCDYFLEPITGPTDYNHLSVRSACAIILDRLLGSCS